MSPTTITYIGGPTALLEYAGLRFVTDPTFDPPQTYAEPGSTTLVKTAGPGIPTLSTRDAASDLFGGSVIGFDSWEIHRLGDVTITAVPALHGPPGSEPWVGKVTGFVLEAPGEPTVYVSGDNASLALVEQIANRFPEIDIAVLFAGAATVPRIPSRLTLSAADARQAAELLGASRVVGLHTEDWEHFAEDAAQFAAAFEGSGLLVPTPRGETVTLAG